jgi:hypothetical protein
MGGDQTANPFLSLNTPPTRPANNSISFMTGVGNYELTRTMGLWLNEPNVRVSGKDYATLTTVLNAKFNPWSVDIAISGTDGMQFSPDLDESNLISTFVSDLSRTTYFSFYEKND